MLRPLLLVFLVFGLTSQSFGQEDDSPLSGDEPAVVGTEADAEAEVSSPSGEDEPARFIEEQPTDEAEPDLIPEESASEDPVSESADALSEEPTQDGESEEGGGLEFYDDGDTEAYPEDDVATPTPLRAAPEESFAEKPDEVERTRTADTYGLRFRNKEEGKPSLFGSYRVRVSGMKPDFDDGLRFYEDLYGTPNIYPMISADWLAFDWYATLGISLRTGMYTANGHAAEDVGGVSAEDLTSDDIVKDSDAPTSLTLLPFNLPRSWNLRHFLQSTL